MQQEQYTTHHPSVKTAAVLVVYQFEHETLRPVLGNLCRQTDIVCVVDNSDEDSSAFFSNFPSVVYFPLLSNRGIAAAQNVALQYILERDYDFVFFSDQDSLSEPDLLQRLASCYETLARKYPNLGGVSPRARNKMTGQPYSHQVHRLAVDEVQGVGPVSEMTFIMSSGSLIPCRAFREVGLMEERLFIDAVECEWCWRARAEHQYTFLVIESLHLDHLLGLGTKRLAGKSISITPAFRLRFQYRNYLWLVRRNYVPTRWKWYNGFKYLAKCFYYTIFSSHRMANARQILAGIKEGIKGER